MILHIVKELQAKNHFWYIDKCHNSVKIYRGVYEKNYKIKKESYLDGKIVFTYVSGLYSGYF